MVDSDRVSLVQGVEGALRLCTKSVDLTQNMSLAAVQCNEKGAGQGVVHIVLDHRISLIAHHNQIDMLKHPEITVTGCVISVNLLKTG